MFVCVFVCLFVRVFLGQLESDWDLAQSDPLSAQIWSPWFGKLQIKQQGYLDNASGNHRLLNMLFVFEKIIRITLFL